ncbi:MAG TPA: efflux transporter outer membrane subunit [Thermodesulfovibrionales bacterium]|nr:efflux transporter outer membrane subunit [Thermodesulfovibrionales bacterium]
MRFLLRSEISLVAAVSLLFTCCSVGPNFRKPDVSVSQNWLEAGDERVKGESSDYRYWWRVFDDPVLDKLIDEAYKNNLTLRIAGVRVLEARAQLGIAIGEFFPQSQQASGSLIFNRPSDAGVIPLSQYYVAQIGLSAAWELDFWGKFRRAIESANDIWLGSIANYDNALVTLTADVANSYIVIRTLEKRIEIARQNLEVQEKSVDIAKARLRYGTASQLDVELAKTQLNHTAALIPPLEILLRQAKDSLCFLLGMPPNDLEGLLGGPSDIPVSPPEVIVGIPTDLLRRRPDIRSAEYRAAAQSAQIGVAVADLYPAFSLTGSFGFLSSTTGTSKLGDLFKWSSQNITAGPSFQWSIFNYGQITNNVRLQDAFFQELLITYQNTVLAAQQEVEDNLVAFLKAQDRAEFLVLSTEAARKSLDLSVLQYREGTKDFVTVLIAQQALLNQQDDLADTLGTISGSLVRVYRALGGGWEIREGKELVPTSVTEEMAKRTNWGRLLAPASYNPDVSGETPSSPRLHPDW